MELWLGLHVAKFWIVEVVVTPFWPPELRMFLRRGGLIHDDGAVLAILLRRGYRDIFPRFMTLFVFGIAIVII